MKILLINNFHFKFGGASVVYLNTAEILRKYGHEVIFFSIKDENNIKSNNEKYFIDRKINVGNNNKLINSIDYFYNFQVSKKLKLLLEIEKPDIAHIHLIYGGLTSSIFPVLKRYNVPIIHTVHDYRIICPAYAFLDKKGNICEVCQGKKFYNCALKKCSKGNFPQSLLMTFEMYFRNAFFNPIKNIDGFCFVSDFSRNKHLLYLPTLSNKESIVLYNFGENKRELSPIKDDYFLFYGRISKEKGLITLLTVFNKMSNVRLKIAGSGPLQESIIEYIKVNKLKNVEFLGFKTGNELVDLISKAYFVIVPSEWYENNPMTVVEAYSFGTPVIGSNIGGIPEIIKNGETGFTFSSRDSTDLFEKIKISTILSKEKYTKLCENAHQFALLNFNQEIYYNKLINFYLTIIDGYKK